MDGTRAEELVERYADAILRIGYTWLGDMDDAKDICQTVLIKLVEEGRRFPDLGQERAWVVRLSVNACKNWKKSAWFRRRAPLEEGLHLAAEVPEPEDGALLALEARRPAPRRQIPLRRVAALAACAGLVLGLVNYQAVAAGTERVIRYFLGVGAAEENLSLLVQGEALHKEDGAFLYRIGGAYQRDGMLTVPVSVFTREGALAEGEELRYRLLVYDADGKKLRRVSSYYDDAKGEMSAPVFLTEGTTYHPSRLDVLADWMSRTYWAQGYTEGETEIYHMEVPDGAKGPYTFDVEVYSNDVSHLGYQPMWEGGVLALDTPQTLDAVSVSRTFQEGTVTALVGDDGHSVAFYGELSPALAAREEKLHSYGCPCSILRMRRAVSSLCRRYGSSTRRATAIGAVLSGTCPPRGSPMRRATATSDTGSSPARRRSTGRSSGCWRSQRGRLRLSRWRRWFSTFCAPTGRGRWRPGRIHPLITR